MATRRTVRGWVEVRPDGLIRLDSEKRLFVALVREALRLERDWPTKFVRCLVTYTLPARRPARKGTVKRG